MWSDDRNIRVVTWNCAGALADKARRLLELEPDVAVIQEAASNAALPGLDRVAWASWSESKGLAVFARPELDATLDALMGSVTSPLCTRPPAHRRPGPARAT